MSESDKIGKGSNMSNEFVKSSEKQLIDNGELVLHIHVNAQSVSIARSDSMLNKAEVSFSIHGEKMS